MPPEIGESNVFLNVPFDRQYRTLFVALIAGLTALGRVPRCSLSLPESGIVRLEKLVELIKSCGASIHDLSRVTRSGSPQVPRFNMPFELGLAFAFAYRSRRHSIFVFEERPRRAQASLSDLSGFDPHVHGGTQDGVLQCLLDCFGSTSTTPSLAELRALTRDLGRTTLQMQRERKRHDPFTPFLFRSIGGAATRLATARGLISG